jgi:hypothetical protein
VGMLRKHTSWSRVVVRAWIIIWMLAVPLFHVHPEADHHHGEAGHIHGGTVHTVFSPDLDGEFGHHQSTTAAVEQQSANQFTLSGLHFHASDYTELGFSFVSDSTDRTLPKPLVSSALIVEPPAQTPLAANPSVIQPLAHSLPLTLLTHDIPARAPPSLLV